MTVEQSKKCKIILLLRFSSVEGKWVNIDKAVDELLPFIRKFILNNGLDPTPLVDFSEYIFPKLVRFLDQCVFIFINYLPALIIYIYT